MQRVSPRASTRHVVAKTKMGNTPLIMAAQEGHEAVGQMLLQAEGVAVNQAKNDGATPLFMAA